MVEIYNEYVGKKGNFLTLYNHVLGVAELDVKSKYFVLRDFTDEEMSHLNDDLFWCFPTKMKVIMYGDIKRTDWDGDTEYSGRKVTFSPICYGDNYDIEDIVKRFTWIDYPHELMCEESIKNTMEEIKETLQREENKGNENKDDENEDENENDEDSEDTGATFSALYDNANIYIDIQKKKQFIECVENVYKEINYWCEKTGVLMNEVLKFFAEKWEKQTF